MKKKEAYDSSDIGKTLIIERFHFFPMSFDGKKCWLKWKPVKYVIRKVTCCYGIFGIKEEIRPVAVGFEENANEFSTIDIWLYSVAASVPIVLLIILPLVSKFFGVVWGFILVYLFLHWIDKNINENKLVKDEEEDD